MAYPNFVYEIDWNVYILILYKKVIIYLEVETSLYMPEIEGWYEQWSKGHVWNISFHRVKSFFICLRLRLVFGKFKEKNEEKKIKKKSIWKINK